jgi:hypothetical protein
VASRRMTDSEMVIRVMPPSTAHAPISAYTPGGAKVPLSRHQKREEGVRRRGTRAGLIAEP